MSKKVLILGSHSSVRGGITTVINSFLENNWKSCTVELLPTYVEGNSLKKIQFFIKFLSAYISRLVRNDFDIAHIHMSYKGSFFRKFIAVKLSKLFNKQVVLHLHGSEFEIFYNSSIDIVKKMIEHIFEISNCVIVLGESWREIVEKITPQANIEVYNNAVKIPNEIVRYNNEKINIVFLGVLIKRKGVYDLIECIKNLNEQEILDEKNIKFIIGGSGQEETNIKELIIQFNLNDYIEMTGWIDESKREEILKDASIFILPSYNEGLPMAILEAMSYGVPVIATNVGSISEVVVSDKTGFLIKPGDVDEMTQSIIQLVNSEKQWNIISDNCKKTIKEKYDKDEYFRRMENLYLSLK